MKVMREIILRKGLPRAVYVDRAGWAGGAKRVEFSQFKRACEELGIQVLFAESPEAKGRVERAFDTFQDRIIPELQLDRIKTMAAANDYLHRQFLLHYWNKRNVVEPRSLLSEYAPLSKRINLDEILCHKEHRILTRSLCFGLNGNLHAIRPPISRPLQGKKIELRFYPIRPMSVYFEGQKLNHTLVKKYQKIERTWEEHIGYLTNVLGIKQRRRPTRKSKNGTFSLGNYRDKIAGY